MDLGYSGLTDTQMPSPFLCRSALLTLYALLAVFLVSVAFLLVMIRVQSSKAAVTGGGQCRPRPPVVDLTLPLWQIPVDFVAYEMLGHRYSEHACCDDNADDDVSSKT